MSSNMISRGIAIVIVFSLILSSTTEAKASSISTGSKLPVRRSIKDKLGRIIDCVDIKAQPSLQHPLLRNHTIQMRPTSLPKGSSIGDHLTAQEQNLSPGLKRMRCRPGTVPIMRATNKDKAVTKSQAEKLQMAPRDQLNAGYPGYHLALLRTHYSNLHGAHSVNRMYDPQVSQSQFSGSMMIVSNGPSDKLNYIAVGWMVNPKVYKDWKSHVFGFWSADSNNQTGCFDMRCPGFIQVSKDYYLGQFDEAVGKQDVNLSLKLFRDGMTFNWHLVISTTEKENDLIGYWPAELFTAMDTSVAVEFGGEVYNPNNEVNPPMGKGTFASEDPDKAGIHCQIQLVDDTDVYREPTYYDFDIEVDSPKCYSAMYNEYQGKVFRYVFSYGGPGGQTC